MTTGIVDQLLELESAKHRALLTCDSSSYEEHVKTQIRLLDTGIASTAAAKESAETLSVLSRLMRLNTVLLLNHFTISPVFAETGGLRPGGYTSAGAPQLRPSSNLSVNG